MRREKHDYFESGDRISDAIDAITSVKSSFVGDTIQARALVLALCDQAGASIEAQRAVAALLHVPEETLPPVLKKAVPR
ncbi:MAG TPA: hypothetical protein VLE97_02010 [Gaiellaceae bacterium]|nr:hypothetical protein [Gaiellaceae bacterium]